MHKKKKMYFEEGCTYHIYNRSNETVFHNRGNYVFFLQKVRKHIFPYAHILCYCLMPNHFHFIVTVKSEGTKFFENERVKDMQYLTRAFGTVISSYTQALNKSIHRRGAVFAHKTKAKMLNDVDNDYALSCFMYVHQNPLLANLVDGIENWEFSSFPDYIGIRKGSLVNKQMGLDIFDLELEQIYELTYQLLQDKSDKDFI